MTAPRLTGLRTRYPALARARFTGATILDAFLRDRRIANTTIADAYGIQEKLVRRWRDGSDKLGLGEVVDLDDAIAEDLLLEALAHVRARRKDRT